MLGIFIHLQRSTLWNIECYFYYHPCCTTVCVYSSTCCHHVVFTMTNHGFLQHLSFELYWDQLTFEHLYRWQSHGLLSDIYKSTDVPAKMWDLWDCNYCVWCIRVFKIPYFNCIVVLIWSQIVFSDWFCYWHWFVAKLQESQPWLASLWDMKVEMHTREWGWQQEGTSCS